MIPDDGWSKHVASRTWNSSVPCGEACLYSLISVFRMLQRSFTSDGVDVGAVGGIKYQQALRVNGAGCAPN